MVIPSEKSTRRFSWNEYREWPEEERWQLIDGHPFRMSAAPNTRHQRMTGNLYRIIANLLVGKPRTPFTAPTDVVFDDFNIVQPDVLVVCDKGSITDANIQGVPDLVIEVLSPSSSFMDRKLKMEQYERFGVPDYLLVDPMGDLVEGKYGRADVFPWHGELPLMSLPGVQLNLWEVVERDLAELSVVREGPKGYG